VVVDPDLPPFGQLEKRVRGIASIASSHAGLRLLLETAFSDQWTVRVREGLAGVTAVRIMPRTPS
jgi:hypothetical protein